MMTLNDTRDVLHGIGSRGRIKDTGTLEPGDQLLEAPEEDEHW